MCKAKESSAPLFELQHVLDEILAFWGNIEDRIDSEEMEYRGFFFIHNRNRADRSKRSRAGSAGGYEFALCTGDFPVFLFRVIMNYQA